MFKCRVCDEKDKALGIARMSSVSHIASLEEHIDSLKAEIETLKSLLGTNQSPNTLPTVRLEDVMPEHNTPLEEGEVSADAMLRGDY